MYTNWSDITVTGASSSISNSVTTSDRCQIIVTSPSGTQASISRSLSEKRISPRLYFKFIKSKLKKTQQQRLKRRLVVLQKLTRDAFELGQQAVYEEYAKIIVSVVREAEAFACGYSQFIDIEDINKFKNIAKDSGVYKSPVYFKTLEDFPRSVPTRVAIRIKDLQEKKLFDKLWILYLDYTHEPIKTNKEKIREKDPILFGQFNYAKNKYFYITDWVDDYCDLTLEGFVSRLKFDDPEFEIQNIPEIDSKYIDQIKKEVADREVRLEKTKRENYKDLMAEETEFNSLRKIAQSAVDIPKEDLLEFKKPWYKRIWKREKKSL